MAMTGTQYSVHTSVSVYTSLPSKFKKKYMTTRSANSLRYSVIIEKQENVNWHQLKM